MASDHKKFKKERLNFCWMPLHAVVNFVNTYCTEEEIGRLPEIVSKWESANKKYLSLVKTEAGIEKKIDLKEMGPESTETIGEIEHSVLFQRNFGKRPYEFKMVELAKLVAFQPYIDLSYAQGIADKIPKPITEKRMIDLCLTLGDEHPGISEVKIGEQQYVFSSDTPDVRFHGVISRPVKEEDLQNVTGGYPVRELVALVGYGSPRVNLYSVNGRIFVNNGIHRAFALYSRGIKYAPAIVVKMANPTLDFPATFMNAPRDFVLNCVRPPLLADLFDPDLTIDVMTKPIRNALRLTILKEDIIVPM